MRQFPEKQVLIKIILGALLIMKAAPAGAYIIDIPANSVGARLPETNGEGYPYAGLPEESMALPVSIDGGAIQPLSGRSGFLDGGLLEMLETDPMRLGVINACRRFADRSGILNLRDTGGVNRIPEPSTMALVFMGLLGSTIAFVRKRYNESRRMLDIVLSVVALVITFPVLLAAAALIKIDSPGPVFYRQVRVGINRRSRKKGLSSSMEKRRDDALGQPFTIYKLRTMSCNAEASTGPVWARKNDTRITKIGQFLRKTRIDEIPQFINVLRGEMSIIGPRPERPVFVKKLNEDIRYYWRRFNVKPGITGLAQVHYRYTDSIEGTRKKLKYDLLYVKRMCLFMDLSILANTIRTVLFARGAR